MVMLRHYHVRTTTPPPGQLWLCPREAAVLCGQAALTAALQAGGVADGYTFEVFYEHFCLTVLDTVAQVQTQPALARAWEDFLRAALREGAACASPEESLGSCADCGAL